MEKLLLGDSLSPALPDEVLEPIGGPYETVVLFLVDSLGWRMLEEGRLQCQATNRIVARGSLSKLNSLFPSATSVHIPFMHSGIPLTESGVIEWMYYESRIGRHVSPLIYSRAEDAAEGQYRKRNSLLEEDIDPARFLPESRFYKELFNRGVESIAMVPAPYVTGSPFADRVITPSQRVPFSSLRDGLTTLTSVLETSATHPRYIFFYYDTVDSTGHKHGPSAPEAMEAISTFFTEVESFLGNCHPRSSTLYTFTADHGQIEIDPAKTIYLDDEISDLERFIPRHVSPSGLIPSGTLRNLFLHVEESLTGSFIERLSDLLEGKAAVVPTSELVAEGIFGSTNPSSLFLDNIGNVAILPFEHESVWIGGGDGRFRSGKRGAHGGLSAEEIEIPFLAIKG